ncbi:MAG TPA: hypothetical protein VFN95_17740 [Flavitalea sp.]|nr:hypothetical protein [Flavitalea sp.]
MKNKSDKTGNKQEKKKKDDSSHPLKSWKDEDKNRMGNDVSSEIKIANAGGHMEGGDNKQWHMDQGNFDDQEKQDFENPGIGQ